MLEKLRDSNIPRDNTQHGQHQQRDRDHFCGFTHIIGMMRINPRFSPKCDKHQPKAIERRHSRRQNP